MKALSRISHVTKKKRNAFSLVPLLEGGFQCISSRKWMHTPSPIQSRHSVYICFIKYLLH